MSTTDYLLGQPLKPAAGTHLLASRDLIEDQWNMAWHTGKPRLLDDPFLFDSSPWEDIQGLPKILRDPDSGTYRMWYVVVEHQSYRHHYQSKPEAGSLPGAYCVAYAESDDGIHWRRPELDVWTTPAGRRTNIVHWGMHGGQMGEILQNLPGGKARFAMAYMDRQGKATGISLAWSDDGIHWHRDDANPVLPCASDCQNNIVYSPSLGRYILITRPYPHASGINEWDPPGHRHMRRRIAVSTSADLRQWTPIRVMIYPDHGDQPDLDNMTAMAYGNNIVGFLHSFDGDAAIEQRMTSHLAISGDGLHWQRFMHEPFLSQHFSGQPFDERSVTVAGTWLPSGDDRMVLFYCGRARPAEGTDSGKGRLVAMTLRRDGFIHGTPSRTGSQVVRDTRTNEQRIAATGDGRGYLLTREFILPPGGLNLNADATAGAVRVEVVCRQRLNAYPGFERDRCVPLIGDSVAMPVRWTNTDIASLAGKPVMLRFIVEQGAKVYAIGLGQ